MRAMDRKVLRDLWHLRGQVMAIGMVIAAGIAALIMSLSTLEALDETTAAYYERYRFGDVFAWVKRAPESVEQRIAELPGVRTVQVRVSRFATVDIEGFAEPVMGQFVSVPAGRQPVLNQLVLRSGRLAAEGSEDEVVLNEPFAEAHNLAIGGQIVALINGHRRELRIVGTALSPEFVYALGPGALMPDDRRFGILWMSHETLAAAYDLKTAFNSVSLDLERGANSAEVMQQLDRILERYGGVGATAREDQLSNWFVMNEMEQLRTMSMILPTIFLVISAFLTNMVLGRLVATERGQIGLMKAFGYSSGEVGLHYAKFVIGIVFVGSLIGIVAGTWLGRMNTQMYADLFRFPILLYRPSTTAIAIAVAVSLVSALLGSVAAVRRAARLPPAQAMSPPAPAVFRRMRLWDTGAARWLDQGSRIIVRNILRSPTRSTMTILGVASAVGLLVLAMQWNDSLDYLGQSYFFRAQHQDATIGLAEPQSETIVRDFEHLPGVLAVEPMRIVGADLSAGPVTHRGSLTGLKNDAWLQPIFDDATGRVVPVPPDGLVLGTVLADKLGVSIGDRVWLEILEGRRPEVALPVVGLVETYIAAPAFINIDVLSRLLKERPSVEYLNLLIDSRYEAVFYARLKELPMVSAVMLRQAAIDSFYGTIVENIMVFITLFSSLACALGFGVAYNSARIALSERGRELATLRVLGFSRGEISYILLGETSLLIAIALPFGCLLGSGLSKLMAASFNTELFRIPLKIEPSTYGLSVIIALAATLISALIVRHRLDHLDLIEVLKTRE
ncbi:MAG: ABC transporter permease [Gammaproteobacteria bacterium]|nr:ABC transporter permease [Gammaproteobacteria bacterium]MDH4256165.1 ABC transporter permease [Gammaproteobacteria bacterium]MDH5261966.1 ABC transporter permease [Gammaproteobacteria bacterium]MDH5620992.1 ABC transporter permease [Gammaproteobacteria bacterium]